MDRGEELGERDHRGCILFGIGFAPAIMREACHNVGKIFMSRWGGDGSMEEGTGDGEDFWEGDIEGDDEIEKGVEGEKGVDRGFSVPGVLIGFREFVEKEEEDGDEGGFGRIGEEKEFSSEFQRKSLLLTTSDPDRMDNHQESIPLPIKRLVMPTAIGEIDPDPIPDRKGQRVKALLLDPLGQRWTHILSFLDKRKDGKIFRYWDKEIISMRMTRGEGVMLVMMGMIIILMIVAVVIGIRTMERYDGKKNMPAWFEKADELYFQMVGRPIDLVSLKYYSIKTSGMSMTQSIKFIQEDLEEYQSQVKRGAMRAKKSRIVIAGLLQNAAFQIPRLRDQCKIIAASYQDYRVVIVENNSKDESRKYLLEWAAKDPKVIILCQDPFVTQAKECDINYLFARTVPDDHSPMPQRIQKMAFLRNIYMEHIHQYYKNYDFLCVMDMDLQGLFPLDGLMHTMYLLDSNSQGGKSIDGVAGNGMLLRDSEDFYYYDSFAFVEENESPMWEDARSKSEHDTYVHQNITQRYSSQMMPDKVRSAFGGVALYRLPAVIKNRYDYSSTHYSCEHSFFHRTLSIWVNPRLLLLIERNG